MKKYIICLFITPLLLILLSCNKDNSVQPLAKNGVIDLSLWNLQAETLALDGEWKFAWKKLLSPEDFSSDEKELYNVPGSWNTGSHGGRKSDGYGTLSLLIKNCSSENPLALKIPSISSAYRLWCGNTMVYENGVVAETKEAYRPLWMPSVVVLPKSRDSNIRLTLQIANFHDRRDGFWGSIILGAYQNISRMRDLTIAFELFLFGSLFIMAIYHFCLFLLRREDKSVIYFAALCLLLSVRTVTGGECFLTLLTGISSLAIYKTLFISFFLIIPAVIHYFISIYPEEVWSPLRYLARAVTAVSVMLIFFSLKTVTSSVIFFEILILILFIYFTVCLVRAVKRKREGALLFLAGWIMLTLTGVNDILFDMGIIWTGLIAPFGLIFFIISQAFLLSLRYASAFRTIEVMSQRLLALDKIKDEFLANTSHELKTPLNGIIGLADSLADGAKGSVNPDVQSDLYMIVNSGKRLSSLVNDILDFSRLRNSDMILREDIVDIKSIVDSVIHLTTPLLRNDRIIMANKIQSDIPLITGDENRLQQIFYNLLGNAVKFTESGRIEISASVKNSGSSKTISISVSDTGIGIESEKINTIFEAFEQADGTVSRSYGGTGIGLSITKHLVELHGGSIDVESEPGRGSVFTVNLPLRENPQLKEMLKEKEFNNVQDEETAFMISELKNNPQLSFENSVFVQHSGNEQGYADTSRRKYTVLVVDDDPVNLQVLENHLALRKYHVLKTRDGFEAINIIETDSRIDIVLLDIMMPRITGYDVAKKIRERFTHFELPVIMLTARDQVSDIVAGIEAGANDFLSKPFDVRELMVRVETLIMLKESVNESKKLANIEQELSIARAIQFSTMPENLPAVNGLDIAVRYIPMESVGGDFYSFQVPSDDMLGILLTDVSGHGVPAALIASMLKIVSNMLIKYADNPGTYLSEMNRILTGNMGNQFLTAVYVFIDVKSRVMLHANAGHEPVLVFKRNNNTLIEDNPKGRIMGWLKDDNIDQSVVALDPGDRIILFTDCITESFNSQRELFGLDSFKKLITDTGHLNPEDCADRFISDLENWTGKKGKFDDDFSLIVIDIQ